MVSLWQVCHKKVVRQAGRTWCTLCSPVSRLHAQGTHQIHFSAPATAFTSFSP
jgi:hypothetical protein